MPPLTQQYNRSFLGQEEMLIPNPFASPKLWYSRREGVRFRGKALCVLFLQEIREERGSVSHPGCHRREERLCISSPSSAQVLQLHWEIGCWVRLCPHKEECLNKKVTFLIFKVCFKETFHSKWKLCPHLLTPFISHSLSRLWQPAIVYFIYPQS